MQRHPLNNDEIGKRIQQYRKKLKMSQEKFAEVLGVDPTLVSRIENGRKSNLTIDLLIQIAEALRVTLNDLCYHTAGSLPDRLSPELESEQKEVLQVLCSLPETERAFLMKMIRAAV